jgi:glycosyltransferase involved in cell wall biosynthesis
MQKADVFVLSSLWEGLPTVLIEAMATGTSVVATDCPTGPREILKGGEMGKLVSSQNSDELSIGIKKAISKKVSKNNLHERLDEFQLDEIINQYQALIMQMK